MITLAPLFVFSFFLVLARVGTCVMTFPALSDVSVPMRVRMLLALTISFALFPILEPKLPVLPEQTSLLVKYLTAELLTGFLLGLGARLFMTAMHIAGELVGFTAGLQSATLFDPHAGGTSTAPSMFLMLITGVLVFSTHLHHVIIQSLAESYLVFPPGTFPPMDDVIQAVLKTIADFFVLGTKLAAPVMAVAFLGYAVLGVLNRLIPQLQVFFVAMPLSIALGLFVFGLILSGMISSFSAELADHVLLFEQEGVSGS